MESGQQVSLAGANTCLTAALNLVTASLHAVCDVTYADKETIWKIWKDTVKNKSETRQFWNNFETMNLGRVFPLEDYLAKLRFYVANASLYRNYNDNILKQ